METCAISGGSGTEGFERNHWWPILWLSRKSDISWPRDLLVRRMSLITGEGRRLREGRDGGRVVRGLRGHHSGGRAHAGSTPRPVVQPLEKLRGF